MAKNDIKSKLAYEPEQQKEPFWPRGRRVWVELAVEAIFGLIVIWLSLHFGFRMF